MTSHQIIGRGLVGTEKRQPSSTALKASATAQSLEAGPLPSEDLFQFVSRVTTEPPGRGAKKIEIHRPLCGLIGRSGVRQILGTAREALHGDEVFSPDDA